MFETFSLTIFKKKNNILDVLYDVLSIVLHHTYIFDHVTIANKWTQHLRFFKQNGYYLFV